MKPLGLWRFIVGLESGRVDRLVMVQDERGECIGCLRFSVSVTGALLAGGTWVAPAWRRRGIATAMWKQARKVARTNKVVAMAVSRPGKSFLRAMANRWPQDFGLVEGV